MLKSHKFSIHFWVNRIPDGQLAQLVEHSLDVRKVIGSNPILPKFKETI